MLLSSPSVNPVLPPCLLPTINTFKRSEWDTNDHNHWMSEACLKPQIAIVNSTEDSNEMKLSENGGTSKEMKSNENNITKTSQIENYEDNEITLKPESTTNTVIIPKLKLDPSGNTLTLDCTKLNTTPTKSDEIFVGPATTTGTNTCSTTQSDEIFNRTASTKRTNTAETPDARAQNFSKFDTRLILNNTRLSRESFISIITDYCTTYPKLDSITNFILTKSKYSNFKNICKRNPTYEFSITGNTPTNTHIDSLITLNNKILNDAAIKLQTTAKRKTYNLKFHANLVNHLYKNAIQPIIFPKIRTTNNGIRQSMIIPAQGDTGANVSERI